MASSEELNLDFERPDDTSDANPLFGIAFSVPAVMSLRRVWHRRTYGTSTLTMDTMPGRLGRKLEARVQTGVDPSTMQGDAFQITLTCYHRKKSGDNTSWRTLWEAETEVQGQRASDACTGPSADASVEIPVSFDLPADAPRSTPEKKSQRIAWILKVSAEMSGLDYQSYNETEDRSLDDIGEEDTVRCDNCYSTVEASASTCPACGADLESGWFS